MRRILPIIMTTALLSAAVAAPATNPLLQPWKGPYGGVPPFDVATPALLAPALEAGMAEHLAELEAIANNPAAPTFANTIAAMERSGRALDRASTVYYIYSSSLSDDAVQEVERNIEPKMAAFRDRITQNEKLFARIAKVYETRESSGLTAEEQRLTWLVYTNFVRAGAKLDAEQTISPACPTRCARALLRTPSVAAKKANGSSPTRALPSNRSSPTPRAATCAKRFGRPSSTAAITAMPATTTRSSAKSCNCVPSARACLAFRPTRTGVSKTRWLAHPSAPWS